MSDPITPPSTDDPLVEMGWRKIWWAERHMRLLRRLREEFERTQPFAGMTIGMCIHVEPKTAVLCTVLRAGGTKLVITGSPGTTKDDVAAALRSTGVTVLGHESETSAEHLENIREVLTHQPTLLLDNGADLVATYLEQGEQGVIAGTEETTTGANRLRADYQGAVPFPIIVINDSPLKLIMENEHGVGPSVIEGFMRETNLLVQSRRFVVFGYGSVGRGIARRLRLLGGHVAVVEPDPIRALEAVLDGMRVLPLNDALGAGEVFFTATGRPGVIAGDSFDRLPDGAILANAGHFSWEIDLAGACAPRGGGRELPRPRRGLHPGGWAADHAAGAGRDAQSGGWRRQSGRDDGHRLLVAGALAGVFGERYTDLPSGPQPVPAEINAQVAREMVGVLTRAT